MKYNFGAISLFLVIFCFFSISASAATITVNTLVDENNTGANCSLREAITAANTNAAFGGCAAGAGTDNINITVSGTISLTASLPDITTPMNLFGTGANKLTIQGNDTFRLLNILLTTASSMSINDLSFTGGRKASGTNAAAIEFNNNGSLFINTCEFYANSGPGAGAADASSVIFTNASALLQINSSTFRNNTVEHVIETGNTPLQLTNSTVSNNTGTGAGVFVFGGMLSGTITNSTIANNNQGLWLANGSGASSITVKNSIFAQNGGINVRRTPGVCPSITNDISSNGNNLFDNSVTGVICTPQASDLQNTNPQIAPLALNGGTTQTRALLANSPARDKIGGSPSADFPFTDQRGAPRPLFSLADIGAYELSNLVSNQNDAGFGSLRYAVDSSPTGETIVFDPLFFDGVTPRTISISAGITINKSLTIGGTGANNLTIAGNNTFRLFKAQTGAGESVTFNDLSFTGGKRGTGENSAAIEINDNGKLNVNRCEFFGNTGAAADGSAVIYTNSAEKINFNASTVRGNTTTYAFYISHTPFDITNSTISGNTGTGAAVFVDVANPGVNIFNSTITGNNQGVWNANTSGIATITLRSTILSDNGGINIRRTGGVSSANPVFTAGFNLINDNSYSQLSNTDATDRNGSGFNARLIPLGYYGGKTQTHAFLSNSDALNAGTSGGLTTDQRGSTRTIGGTADIGAFERNITLDQTTLPNGNTQLSYSQQLSATRQTVFSEVKGVEPFTVESVAPTQFAVVPVSGQSLPPGLTLSPSGLLSGMPTAGGFFTFTIKATDTTDGMAGVQQYTIQVFAPSAANVSVSGRIFTNEGETLGNARVSITDANGNIRTTLSNSFGYYNFSEIAAGQVYTFNVRAKGYTFEPQVILVYDNLSELNFTAR